MSELVKVPSEAPSEAPPKDELWIARDGRRLLVGEMDEEHVRNALRMMLRARRRAMQLKALHTQLEFMRKLADEIDDDRKWGDD